MTIGMSVEYNTPGSVGLLAPMQSLKLKFGDFLCPVPASDDSIASMVKVFPLLWATLKAKENALNSECMQTVVRIRVKVTMDQVKEVLGRFLITDDGGKKEEKQQRFSAFALLLPNVQLLFDGTLLDGKDECSIHVLTNNQ